MDQKNSWLDKFDVWLLLPQVSYSPTLNIYTSHLRIKMKKYTEMNPKESRGEVARTFTKHNAK